MTVGFYLDYVRSDAVFMALQLARRVEDAGVEVSLLSSRRADPVHPVWDDRLLRRDRHSYLTWLSGLASVVFETPPPGPLVDAAKQAGVRTMLLLSWTDLTEDTVDRVAAVDHLICPARAVHRHLRDAGVPASRLTCLPWDTGQPLTRSDHRVDPKRLGLYWNLDGTQPMFQDRSFARALDRLLKSRPVYLTAGYTGDLAPGGLAELRRLAALAPGRVELIRSPGQDRHPLTVASHDLTLWPSLLENAGLPGLTSLTAGVPVLAYDHPVVAELVKDEVNGVLVACELSANWCGVPAVVDAADAFVDRAIELVDDPDRLQRLRAATHHGLERRREKFVAGVAALFGV